MVGKAETGKNSVFLPESILCASVGLGKGRWQTQSWLSHLLPESSQGGLCGNVHIDKVGVKMMTRMTFQELKCLQLGLLATKSIHWLYRTFSLSCERFIDKKYVRYLLFFLFPLQIYAVRSVVPNKSNNEIVLVLQQFDFNVDKAVQAFVDGEYRVSPEAEDVRMKYLIHNPCAFFSLSKLNITGTLVLIKINC